MPWNTVRLKPGITTQLTQALNEAGVSQSNLIRYHDGLIQKLGGWTEYYTGTTNSTIREIHGWADSLGAQYLAVGATGQLAVITAGSLSDITPTTHTTNVLPDFTISSASSNNAAGTAVNTIVTIKDAGSSASVFDSVYFNTPVAIGNLLLSGNYPIYSVIASSAYQIVSSVAATTTVVSSGTVPSFITLGNNAVVDVFLSNNNYSVIPGEYQQFIAPTTVGGLTIQGQYQITSLIDSTEFTIISPLQATTNDSTSMNSGLVQSVFYEGYGPPSAGTGYGVGGYGLGGWGLGSSQITSTSIGTPITATDWTMDNWGSIILACPTDGPIYSWAAGGGFTTATVVGQAPFFNGGIFISQPQQILVAWRSVQNSGVQDPLIVRWSDSADYTNWAETSQTTAGSFHIPVGSKIMGGVQAGLRGVIWTDTDVWIMQYVGGDVIFNFTRMGTGCGLIGPHAAGVADDRVYWCGTNNLFVLSAQGVEVVPCSVWDFLFQNLNTAYTDRIYCAVNSMFSEVTWYFPSTASTGENDSYIRLNITENEWDYGTLSRTAWNDVSALGNPIGTTTTQILQHETSNDGDGLPINGTFTTGFWTIADGEEFAFVDYVVPDMKFGVYSDIAAGADTAQCEITISVVDYPGDTPRTYGPVTFTSTTKYLTPRLRGRFMSLTIDNNNVLGSFWRIGAVKYRWASAGRR